MTETDPTPEESDAGSGRRTSGVLAQGEVPFAVLPDQRIVMARFRTTFTPQPFSSLSDPESTEWTLALDGREFRLTSEDVDQPDWLPIGNSWALGREAPLTAVSDGERHVARYRYFYGHHLGWLSGDVTLAFDTRDMTVEVSKDLTFEPD